MSANGSDRTTLVTGATGFTGGALARRLLERGDRVRTLVRPNTPADELESAGAEVVRGDLRNAEDVSRAVEGVDTIYHIAAVFRSPGLPDQYYHDVNAGGVRNVVAAARSHRVRRTVHCSTVGVHGHVSEIPADEDSPDNPGDIYQETKLAGERIAQEAFADDVPGVVFRPAGIYGPGDVRFLKLFRAIKKRRFPMFGSGETLYHFTYIDDLVDGILLCGERPDALGRTYILAGESYVTLNELVRLIAEAMDVPPPRIHLPFWPLMAASIACEAVCRPLGIDPPLFRRRAEFFIKDRAFSIQKAQSELGYTPKVGMQEGIRRTAEWYRSTGRLDG